MWVARDKKTNSYVHTYKNKLSFTNTFGICARFITKEIAENYLKDYTSYEFIYEDIPTKAELLKEAEANLKLPEDCSLCNFGTIDEYCSKAVSLAYYSKFKYDNYHPILIEDFNHSTLDQLSIYTSNNNILELTKEYCYLEVKFRDILHHIELDTFNAYEGYLFAKDIKDIRLRRRTIKNHLAIIKKIHENIGSLNKNIESALKQINGQEYSDRV